MILNAENILVVLPNWVGDNVLATPALRAIRAHYSRSRISYLMKPYLTELFNGCPWYDQLIYWPGKSKGAAPQTILKLMKQIRAEKFDAAVLLSNSFRAALTCSLCKIPRRIGYDRDGRGVMLTDKLLPDRYNGRFLPISALKYYLSVADYLGCRTEDYHLELFTDPQSEAEADGLLLRHGLEKNSDFAVINPGASYGPTKCWPTEYFAEVGDYLYGKFGLRSLIVGSPRETPIVRSVAEKMTNRGIAVVDPVAGLGALKSIIKRSKLLVTNDTGPRHFAAAFGVPVVTIFGSTDPRWSETLYVRERQIRVEVECGPCMKKTCPERHHKCMTDIKPERVEHQIEELLQECPTTVEK
jgi:heptosyltransferase-2